MRRLAGRQKRQFVIGRLQQRARQHTEEFRRRIDRQVERLAGDRLLAVFAAIFPARPAVLQFESALRPAPSCNRCRGLSYSIGTPAASSFQVAMM